MVSGRLHIWFGLAVAVFSSVCIYGLTRVPWLHLIWISLIIFVYAQLPDIDHRNSNITWIILSAGLLLSWASLLMPVLGDKLNTLVLGLSICTLVAFTALFLKHRGPTHTIWFCLLSPLLLLLVPSWPIDVHIVMLFAAVASYSHLLADGYLFKVSLKPKRGLWGSPPKNLNNSIA